MGLLAKYCQNVTLCLGAPRKCFNSYVIKYVIINNLPDYNQHKLFICLLCYFNEMFMHYRKLSNCFLSMQERCSLIYWSDWVVKARSPLTFHLIGREKNQPSVLVAPLAGGRVSLPASLKFSPPSKKLVCGFHWLWHRNVLPCRLGCSRYVPMWGIMLLVVLLVSCTQSRRRCQFKAV